MACGLPCIVVNNGGIGEYVTEETGYKIDPHSRSYVVEQLTVKIKELIHNPELREQMSLKAVERAKGFTWQNKGKAIVELYDQFVKNSS